MWVFQHHFKVFGVCCLSRGQRWERLFVGGILPPPFFYSLSLLSQLPNISFDVYCWDFKRTLSTWAGVGFSEQARESHILLGRGVSPTHTFLALPPRAVPGLVPCPGSRRPPGSRSPHAASSWALAAEGVSRRGGGCAPGLSPCLFKACPKGSVFFQSLWREVV